MSFVAPLIPLLSGLGAAAGAVGAIGSGEAQAQAANYQAQVASNNSIIAKQNAAHAAGAESAQAEEAGLQARQQDAGVKAGFAANNLDTTSGSTADVESAQRQIGDLNVANVANRGAEAVYGYGAQATGYQAQSNLYSAEAPSDVAAGFLKAGSLIGNAAPNLPTSWMGGNPTANSFNDIDVGNGITVTG